MKYCLPYIKSSKYLEQTDEFIIGINKEEDINQELVDLIENYPDKRFILSIVTIDIEKNLKALKEIAKKKNVVYMISFKQDSNLLREENIPFFFAEAIDSYEILNKIIQWGVTDVYIASPLTFNLEAVRKVVGENINIRVYANFAQAHDPFNKVVERDIKSFFIRPEDVEFYSNYIDYIEFIAERPDQFDTFYKIYAIDKKWFGNLREIIYNLSVNIDNRFLFPYFASKRVNCDKKCLKGKSCTFCDRVIPLIESLEKENLVFTKD